MYTASMDETGTFDFSSADLMAVAPSSVAETVVKLPLNWRGVSWLNCELSQTGRCSAYHCRRRPAGAQNVCIPNFLVLLSRGAELALDAGQALLRP
jgi:hypothetical protein